MDLVTGATVIRWLGQACFTISTLHSPTVLIDPPNPQIGYAVTAHSIPANLVFVSHSHPDHSYVEAAKGAPMVVQPMTAPGPDIDGKLGAITYRRIFAFHDNAGGTKRGPDTITVIKTNGLRIVHVGDLGEFKLTAAQVKDIGPVDVLMIPVGGFYTIDGQQAVSIVTQLHPRVIVPMHYGTPALSADLKTKLAPASVFLGAMKGRAAVVSVKTRDLQLSPKTLPKKQTIYMLRYE